MKTRRYCAALLIAAFSLAGCQGNSGSHLTPSTTSVIGKKHLKPNTVVSNQCVPLAGQTLGTITEYPIPTASTQPYGLTADQNGNIWFAEYGASALGKFNIAGGTFNSYATTTHSSEPISVTIASDGNPWFPEFASGKLAKFDTSTSSMTEYGFSGGTGSYPAWIDNSTVSDTAGMWVPLNGDTDIANVTTSGAITYHTAINRPYASSIDTAGNIWYTTYNTNEVFEGIVGHTANVWTIPTSGSQPANITEGPNGTGMWVTEFHGNKIANINTSGHITEYTIPTSASGPLGIVSACGNIWFAETATNKIGELNPTTGSFTEYAVPTASSDPTGVAVDANGNVWFTERNTNKLAMIATSGAASPGPDGAIYLLNSSGGNIVNYATGSFTPPPAAVITSVPGSGASTVGSMAFDSSGDLWVTTGTNVSEYAPGASGSATPLSTFTTADSTSNTIAVDAAGEIIVGTADSNAIDIYAAGSTGSPTPTRVISGSSTDLDGISRLIVDGSGNLWVANTSSTSVAEFPTSASGNVAPSLYLDSTWASNNGISTVNSISIDHSGELLVLGNNGEHVFTFASGVGESSTYTRQITTQELGDIAVDDEGYIYGAAQLPDGVLIYPPAASGTPAPYINISGSNDGLSDPQSIAVFSNSTWWYGGDGKHKRINGKPKPH